MGHSEGWKQYEVGGVQQGNFPRFWDLEPPTPSNGPVSVWAVSRPGQPGAEMLGKIDRPEKRT